jgi:hypothetical protein
VILDHRLDHEGGLRQGLGVGHDLDVLRVGVGAEAPESPLNGGARAVGRVLRASEQKYRTPPTPVMGRGGGQAAGDRAAAGDCKTFVQLHLSSSLFLGCSLDGLLVVLATDEPAMLWADCGGSP